MSFRLRLTLFGATLVALTLLTFGWLVYELVTHSQATAQDDALTQRAGEVLAAIKIAPGSQLTSPSASSLTAAEDLGHQSEIFAEVLDASGAALSTTGRIGDHAPAIPADALHRAVTQGHALWTFADNGIQLRAFLVPWSRPDLGLIGTVAAAQPLRIQSSNLKGLLGFLFISSIPTLLAALIASWLVAGRALKPLKTVAETADSIGQTRDLRRRLPESGRADEIRLLSRSFNRMLEQLHDAYERLAQALEAQRRFVADASHELRTPLTTIRGNAGLLATGPAVSDEVRSAAAKDIATEAERMSRLVEHLLTLAEADAGQRLTLAPVALRQIIADVCRQAQAVHLDRTVRSAGLTDATVPGDADALTQLLWILVDNAVKFTSAGGHIELGLQQHEGRALLTVADDGTGIPASDLERIFTRFYQVDASRSGTGSGLGLSIARWIVDEHHGSISARNNDGPGSTFTAALPLAPDAA